MIHLTDKIQCYNMKNFTYAVILGCCGILFVVYGFIAIIQANDISPIDKPFISEYQMILALSSLPAIVLGFVLLCVSTVGLIVTAREETTNQIEALDVALKVL